MNKTYGKAPLLISYFYNQNDIEMLYYQYLPIKMKDSRKVYLPEQLEKYRPLIDDAIKDYINRDGKLLDTYVYLTAKCIYTLPNQSINREGWHSDGFMSEDINYIWSDYLPTEYVLCSADYIEQDHEIAMKQFDLIGSSISSDDKYHCEPNVLYRLDDTVIHRPQVNKGAPILRQFIKISFSKDKYNLKGNSHNYLIDYVWDMKKRDTNRNHPTK